MVDALADLQRDGYALIEDVLDPSDVKHARDELERILVDTPYGRGDFEGRHTRHVYALFGKTRALDGMATHPTILALLDAVLGEYHLSAPTAIDIGPGERSQPLHPDDATYPIPRPHAELVVNIMWPLQEFTKGNGTTRIVPGSHTWVDEFPGPDTETVSVEMPAGAALVYLGSVWHGGGANTTDETRLGVVMHYSRRGCDRSRTTCSSCRPTSLAPCPSACKSCSDTTSRSRSSATSTGATPRSSCPEGSCGARRHGVSPALAKTCRHGWMPMCAAGVKGPAARPSVSESPCNNAFRSCRGSITSS